MKKIQVTTKAEIDELAKNSSFTIEGLLPDEENLTALAYWIKEYTPFKGEETFYTIEGKIMNESYGLTDSNAYPDENCTMVCVKLGDLENPMAIAIPRFQIGGRWLDDICDNNEIRQREINAKAC